MRTRPLLTSGLWASDEKRNHINYLELLAVFLGLKALCSSHRDRHISLKIDNTTAVAVINHMGTSHSGHLNKLCKEIWDCCIARNLWISAGHIAGKANVKADLESRQNQTITEWMLNTTLFLQSLKTLQFAPDIDLFASRLNKQLPDYVVYRPDPESIAIDCLHNQLGKNKVLCLSSLQCYSSCAQEDPGGRSYWCLRASQLADTGLVPQGNENDGTGTGSVGSEKKHYSICATNQPHSIRSTKN